MEPAQFWTIVRHHLRLQRLPLFIWSGLMVLMGLGTMTAAPAATAGNVAEKLIEGMGMRGFAGAGPSAYVHPIDWFIALKFLAWAPLFFSIYTALAALGAISREEEGRTSEFLLSLPVVRRTIILGRMVSIVIGLMAIVVAAWAGLAITAAAMGLEGSEARYLMALLGSVTIALALGCLSLLISLIVKPYGRALRWALGLITALFLYDTALRVASPSLSQGLMGWLTPFGWIEVAKTIQHGSWPVSGMLTALAASCVLTALSSHLFSKREVL